MSAHTILIVDGDESVVKLFKLALQSKTQWNVFGALNGLKALEQAEQHLPNLVLPDVMLPDMNGIEVCQRLCAAPATAGMRSFQWVVRKSAQSDSLSATFGG